MFDVLGVDGMSDFAGDFECGVEIVFGDGEGNVGEAFSCNILDDHVDRNFGGGECGEEIADDAWLIGESPEGDEDFTADEGDTGDDCWRVAGVRGDECSGTVGIGRAYSERHGIFFGELDGA